MFYFRLLNREIPILALDATLSGDQLTIHDGIFSTMDIVWNIENVVFQANTDSAEIHMNDFRMSITPASQRSLSFTIVGNGTLSKETLTLMINDVTEETLLISIKYNLLDNILMGKTKIRLETDLIQFRFAGESKYTNDNMMDSYRTSFNLTDPLTSIVLPIVNGSFLTNITFIDMIPVGKWRSSISVTEPFYFLPQMNTDITANLTSINANSDHMLKFIWKTNGRNLFETTAEMHNARRNSEFGLMFDSGHMMNIFTWPVHTTMITDITKVSESTKRTNISLIVNDTPVIVYSSDIEASDCIRQAYLPFPCVPKQITFSHINSRLSFKKLLPLVLHKMTFIRNFFEFELINSTFSWATSPIDNSFTFHENLNLKFPFSSEVIILSHNITLGAAQKLSGNLSLHHSNRVFLMSFEFIPSNMTLNVTGTLNTTR